MIFFKKIIIAGFVLFSSSAFSGVGLNQTRIIIDGNENSASVVARNTDDSPYLVANYITELVNAKPVGNDFFIITPQVFKLDANSLNTIKVQAIPGMFPSDRESMYYFHSRNVPATNGQSGVKVGLENIIKVFYRPTGLTMTSKDAYAALDIKSDINGIKMINGSPYFINLQKIKINNDAIKLNSDSSIIAPYSEANYMTANKSGQATWVVINELGGTDEYSKNF
ncbi:fimbrial biogenesis chaperone [Morganella morganii]|uniref:fimbrial biogenesis chaperone n=1 Tax=Morganella morganii TaxID=582 RepID=UPI00141A0C2D|nr:molecular chaperone [Morganella morganii]NIH18984.1 molecular chaperone [Morganella morganii]